MFSWNRWTFKNLVNLSWFTFNNSLFIMNDSSYGFNRPSLVRKGRWDHLSLLCQHDDCKRNAFIVDDDHHDSVMAMTFLRSLSQKGTYCNRLILQFLNWPLNLSWAKAPFCCHLSYNKPESESSPRTRAKSTYSVFVRVSFSNKTIKKNQIRTNQYIFT